MNEDIEKELRDAYEARSPFGPLGPEQAMKNIETWVDRDKECVALVKENEERRSKILATPIKISLDDGKDISIGRLPFEEMYERIGCAISYSDEIENIIKAVLSIYEREGLIKIP